MIIKILQIIAGVATVATGVVSTFWPNSVRGFTGLEPAGGRGITEIRSIFGGLFIALGGVALFYRTSQVYNMLGIMYLVIALVRAVSMILDKSVESSNVISLVVEIVFGLILIIRM